MTMLRQEVIETVLRAFPREPIIVTLGTTSREVIAAAPDAPNHLHLLDSMGLAPAVAAGLALGLADRYTGTVVAFEGDGGLLMGFSILATLAHLRLSNLLIVILDDGAYGATGGQPSGSANVDICAAARACGIEAADVIDSAGLARAVAEAKAADRSTLIRARVEPAIRKLPHYLPDPPVLTALFRQYIDGLH